MTLRYPKLEDCANRVPLAKCALRDETVREVYGYTTFVFDEKKACVELRKLYGPGLDLFKAEEVRIGLDIIEERVERWIEELER